MSDRLEQFRAASAELGTEAFVRQAVAFFAGRLAFATSLGAEDQVLTDILARVGAGAVKVFTIDTGRLPQETHDVIDATARRYGLAVHVLTPERADVEALVAEDGVNGFYRGVEARRRCCHVRKVLPLRRALAGMEAWMTGLRRQQAATRGRLERVELDEANAIIKLNPLADWTTDDVWTYIRRHDVPVNALHERGYPSIGCGPCTRRVEPGQDIRAGRWWWEQPEHKECGLHLKKA